MKKNFLLMIVFALIMASCSSLVAGQSALEDDPDRVGSDGAPAYQTIAVQDLHKLMQADDLLLINVHIPLEGSIPGTDTAIPYNEVENYLADLPQDKNTPIYLYCRSDAMGHTAAQTLLELGYTDIYNLEGGYIAWQAAGLPFEE